MDRARDFHFVKQLPRRTPEELGYQEAVYDHQVLLNESWQEYCVRVGYAEERLAEEHVKWVTETWQQYENRLPGRDATIARYFDLVAAREEKIEQGNQNREAIANDVLALLAQNQMAADGERLDTLNTLLVDFELKLLNEQRIARDDMEADETAARNENEDEEARERAMIDKMAAESLTAVLEILEARRKAQEEEDRRRREEEARLEAERLREEEERRRQAEEAERRRREEEEEARRAEKRRKDEERKARARAEREARAQKKGGGAAAASAPKQDSSKLRDAARAHRMSRMTAECNEYLVELQAAVDGLSTEDQVMPLCGQAVERLGSQLLFDSAVYLGVLDESAVKYVYASSNCSEAMRSGNAAFVPSGECPTAACFSTKQPQFVADCAANPAVVRVGNLTDWGQGDFLAVPICRGGEVVSVLGCDTVSGNAHIPSTIAEEKDLHLCNPGESLPKVPISEEQRRFLEQVGALLSEGFSKFGSQPETTPVGQMKLPPTSNLTTLYQTFCHAVRTLHGGLDVYISAMHSPNGKTCSVVCHNGMVASDPMRDPAIPSHLLGLVLDNANAATFTISGNNHLVIPDVASNDACIRYDGGAKTKEFLLLCSVADQHDQRALCVGVSHPDAIPDDVLAQILQLVGVLRERFQALQRSILLSQLCSQAVEWVNSTTGLGSVYVSLLHSIMQPGGSPDVLQYIAASEGQGWLLGKELKRGQGVSFDVLDAPYELHLPHVAGTNAVLWDDALKDPQGSLACCAIRNSAGATFGVLYADTVKDGKPIAQADLEMLRLSAGLLGEVITEVDGGISETGEVHLAVEDVAGPQRIRFLKRVLLKINADIKGIPSAQLLEMANYKSPPDAIQTVTAATFIVLGAKPKAVAEWDDCRKRIKQPLLEKLANFDPTKAGSKSKNFFIRAKKMIKGYTADTVFQRGSYPASCFFSWTFVAIKLRYASDALRKSIKSGKIGLDEEAASVAQTEATDGLADLDAMGHDDEDMEAEINDEE